MADRTITVGNRTWTWIDVYGWVSDEDDPAWVTESALLDEIERLQAEVDRLSRLNAEYAELVRLMTTRIADLTGTHG